MNWDETLERVRSAAEFCATAGLTRFRIEQEDLGIDVSRSVRRSPPRVAPAGAAGDRLAEVALHAEAGQTGLLSAPKNGASPPAERPNTVVKAEFVGIVRFSRPTVVQGTILTEDRELAYVESLGIRNPVRSGAAGRVAAVYVSDGEPVGYGQPLFAIEA